MTAIHINRGLALWQLQRFDEAIASYGRAIACDPQNAIAYNERGNAYYALGREGEALQEFEQAVALNFLLLPARKNRGLLLLNTQKYEAALLDFAYAVQVDVDDAQLHYSLGLTLLHLNRHSEAIACFERSLALNPEQPDVVFNEQHSRLAAGDLLGGWKLFERRWEHNSMKGAIRNYTKPLWLGNEPIAGQTILLWPEQGEGDSLQFCRYALLLEQRQAKVLLFTRQSMYRLLKQSFARTKIVVMLDGGDAEFDFHAPLMSLPLGCGTDSVEKIPASIPYLLAAPIDVEHWHKRIMQNAPQAKRRVGLVWAGGSALGTDGDRSLRLEQFAPLLELTQTRSVQFFSLQLGEPAKQIKDVRDASIIDLTADLHDWADTAALVASLDLVISCDTAVAHLAAAMGKPTWVLSRFNGCWRWLEDRDDSPWYPTVRLFRQKTRGDWEAVIAEVARALDSYNV